MRDDIFDNADLAEKIAQPPERYLDVLRDFCGLVELNFEEVVASDGVTLGDVHIGFMHFGVINPTCMKIIVELNLPPSERKESVYLQMLQANAVLPVEGLAFASVPETDRLALVSTISLDEKHGLNGQQLHDKILALAELSKMGQVISDRSFSRAVFTGFNKI
ncbi:hypothetical protein [Noviherbaspirillum sp.]|uniref:hypothetical protein n=1 Tax=Noviherbaspirillum sp. TaxID=1926288 RepID=UPI002B45E25F|nr:hypothetical protein [Noviherbaspirillum sp.]HJV80599.1 hypothetical protein [Noviherbaspirillum sp.]